MVINASSSSAVMHAIDFDRESGDEGRRVSATLVAVEKEIGGGREGRMARERDEDSRGKRVRGKFQTRLLVLNRNARPRCTTRFHAPK